MNELHLAKKAKKNTHDNIYRCKRTRDVQQIDIEWHRQFHRQWKQGQVPWEKYVDVAQLCREGDGKQNWS